MIVTKLILSRFGRFRDETVELQGGFSVLQRPNEWGKSTLADFVDFILYGFTKPRARNLSLLDNPREKYIPLDGETLSGAMEATLSDGRMLRIERVQGKKADKVTVLDARTGQPAADFSGGQPGEWLFGVDQGTFERTAFVRQTGHALSPHESMETRLRNLVTVGDERMSYDGARDLLEDAVRVYAYKNRAGGLLDRLRREEEDGQRELAESRARYDGYLKLSEEQKNRNRTLLADRQKVAELEKACENALLYEEAEKGLQRGKLLEEARKCRAEAAVVPVYPESLPGALRAAAAAGTGAEKRRIAAGQKAEQAKREAEASAVPAHVSAALENERKKLEQGENKVSLLRIMGALGAVVGILAAVLSVAKILPGFWWIPGLILLAAGAACFWQSGRVRAGTVSAEQIARREEELLQAERSAAAAAALAQAALAELASAEEEARGAKAALQAFGISDEEQAIALADEAERARATVRQLEDRAALLEQQALALPEPKGELPKGKPEASYRELAAELELYRSRLFAGERVVAQNERDLKNWFEDGRTPVVVEAELARVRERREEAQRRYDALTLAQETLREAFDELQGQLAPLINQRAGEILSEITGGKRAELLVDYQYNFSIRADGQTVPYEYFSQGTRDAAYLALRLTMTELLYTGERPPLIFDDAFAAMDDGRLAALLSLLRRREDQQILLLCCSSREACLLEELQGK